MAASASPAPTIIRRKQVEALTGLSTSTIYAKFKRNPNRPHEYDPSFPRPIRLGAKSVGWVESEVIGWIEAKIAASRGGRDAA